MEVHQHPHTPRKKWTHYFWEFLMLFLAVFCGFLAEYQLEHKIESEKGRQYIRLFYEDLKEDTLIFTSLINKYQAKIAGLSNRQECFDSLNGNLKADDCLIKLIINADGFPDLIYTDRTLQQLKNAGGLRLLRQSDADSILNYENLLRRYKVDETTSYQETQTELRSVFYSLVNYKRLGRLKEKGSVPLLYPGNRELLNRYFNLLELYTLSSQQNQLFLEVIKERAISLIRYFKEKYNLK
jgi:hypothetical protein